MHAVERMSEVEFHLMKIQMHVLKVHIHCEGCAKKVKKVLKGIEGVYGVDIILEEQKVIVRGNVDSETLIKKLKKSRKHAELWSSIQTENHNLEALNNWITDDKYQNIMQDLVNDHDPSQTMMSPVFGREDIYLKDIAGTESLMDARTNSYRLSSMENRERLLKDDCTIADPRSGLDSNMRCITGFQDWGNNVGGGFEGFEGAEFPRLRNLHIGLPTYPPVMMMNNGVQHQMHDQYPMMMNYGMPEFHGNPSMMVHGNGYIQQEPLRLMNTFSDRFSPRTYHS